MRRGRREIGPRLKPGSARGRWSGGQQFSARFDAKDFFEGTERNFLGTTVQDREAACPRVIPGRSGIVGTVTDGSDSSKGIQPLHRGDSSQLGRRCLQRFGRLCPRAHAHVAGQRPACSSFGHQRPVEVHERGIPPAGSPMRRVGMPRGPRRAARRGGSGDSSSPCEECSGWPGAACGTRCSLSPARRETSRWANGKAAHPFFSWHSRQRTR